MYRTDFSFLLNLPLMNLAKLKFVEELWTQIYTLCACVLTDLS